MLVKAASLTLGWRDGCRFRMNSMRSDAKGDTVKRIEGYVPKIMCPGDNGHGVDVIMQIDGAGKIHGWVAALGNFSDKE